MPSISPNKLPFWVAQLLSGYILPDEVGVKTSIAMGNFLGSGSPIVRTDMSFVGDYPGAIPDFSVNANVEPMVTHVSYNIELKKAVGFVGFVAEVSDYNQAHFNDWSFPVERRNFGYMAFSNNDNIASPQPIHFKQSLLLSHEAMTRTAYAKMAHDTQSLLVAAEHACMNGYAFTLYKQATIRLKPIPVYEVWEVSWTAINDTPDYNDLTCSEIDAIVGSRIPDEAEPIYQYWLSCRE